VAFKNNKLAIAVFVGGLVASSHTMAAGTLSGEEVKKLIVGNTAHGVAPSGKPMKNYFDPSGTLVRSVGGKVIEGSYSISDDGTQCIKVGKADTCAKIANNGDGTYHRVDGEGKVLLKWEKIVPGKDLP